MVSGHLDLGLCVKRWFWSGADKIIDERINGDLGKKLNILIGNRLDRASINSYLSSERPPKSAGCRFLLHLVYRKSILFLNRGQDNPWRHIRLILSKSRYQPFAHCLQRVRVTGTRQSHDSPKRLSVAVYHRLLPGANNPGEMTTPRNPFSY